MCCFGCLWPIIARIYYIAHTKDRNSSNLSDIIEKLNGMSCCLAIEDSTLHHVLLWMNNSDFDKNMYEDTSIDLKKHIWSCCNMYFSHNCFKAWCGNGLMTHTDVDSCLSKKCKCPWRKHSYSHHRRLTFSLAGNLSRVDLTFQLPHYP